MRPERSGENLHALLAMSAVSLELAIAMAPDRT
jgi:hypothetical protein